MIFQANLKMNKFHFSIISSIERIHNPIMTVHNGSIKSIEKNILKLYASRRLQDAQETISQGNSLMRSVQSFKYDIECDPVLKMSLQSGIQSIPKEGILYNTTANQFFHTLSNICTQAPKFEDERIIGVPFLSLFIDLIQTRHGQTFFGSKLVNEHLKEIFNDYNIMLCSKVSLKYMNEEEPYGWFCKRTLKHIDYEDYYVDKTKAHWGFRSWNDWFTRSVRPERRPIDQRANSIVHSSDSYPLYYKPGEFGRNPYQNLKAEDSFWLKDNLYSLHDTFGAKKMGITKLVDDHFVGGTVYQAFLDPWCYHRWHSPVSGTLIKSYRLDGTYYLSNPNFDQSIKKSGLGNYISSMPMLSAVSTRHIFIIKLDDDSNRYIGLVQIGMAEVSSCRPIVIQGQHVEKGEQLGRFQFGGSSYVVIFDKNFNLIFNPSISFFNSQTNSTNKQLVNSQLATY